MDDATVKTEKTKLAVCRGVSILLAAVTVACCGLSYRFYAASKKPGAQEASSAQTTAADVQTTTAANAGDTVLPYLKKAVSLNKDTVGWLRIPSTSIDTLVVQGKNNSQYLRTGFYGVYNRYGNIFLDYRCDARQLSANTIIYGHTTENTREVFYDLTKYKDPAFFKANPVLYYDTLYEKHAWKVAAVFLTAAKAKYDNGYLFFYITPTFKPGKFEGYAEQVRQRALYETGVDFTETDKLLTLSTCAYDFNSSAGDIDTRLVVLARMLRPGESESVDPSLVKPNPDYRRPQVWYDRKGLTNPYRNEERWTP